MPRARFAELDYYDVWLPNLAPSQELMSRGRRAQDERQWQTFVRGFRAEMSRPDAARVLDLLAALSHRTSFAIGCYCEEESRCHRSVLRELLVERGAELARG